MRASALGLVCLLIGVGCSDDDVPPARDGKVTREAGTANEAGTGNEAGTANEAGTGNEAGTTKEGGSSFPEAGWLPTEAGPVKVSDGGVLVSEDSGMTYVCRPTTCAGKLLECGDCVDNDGDGRIDFRDQECLGPCDNTEGPALTSGVGGDTGSSCGVDCYFDFGNGSGNDKCVWDHRCDPLNPEKDTSCPYDADFAKDTKKCPAEQPKACADFCLPYTPNGCDCFGCCTFPELTGKGPGGKDVYVWIGAKDPNDNTKGICTFDTISDPTKCPPCTPIANCLNECGPCEVCIGRPVPPAECFKTPPKDGGTPSGDGGPADGSAGDGTPGDGSTSSGDSGPGVIDPGDQCPGGDQPCGLPGQAQCPALHYCISGCCKRIVI